MFNKTYSSGINSDSGINLAFIRSSNIQVFPCGRRRSQLINSVDINKDSINDNYYLPFDPEARLNTEFNNRKQSGLGGFAQTFIKEFDSEKTRQFSLSLAGYLFTINLETATNPISINDFCNQAVNILCTNAQEGTANSISSLYANIVIEEIPLYSGFADYNTKVLRNQSASNGPSTSLDLYIGDDDSGAFPSNPSDPSKPHEGAVISNPADYYFSGLSISAEPRTNKKDETVSELLSTTEDGKRQTVVSLHLFDKVNGSWVIHQPALLPRIEHGSEVDSVKVFGDTGIEGNANIQGNINAANDITAGSNITANGDITASAINISNINFGTDPLLTPVVAKDVDGRYQLKFIRTVSDNKDVPTIEELE